MNNLKLYCFFLLFFLVYYQKSNAQCSKLQGQTYFVTTSLEGGLIIDDQRVDTALREAISWINQRGVPANIVFKLNGPTDLEVFSSSAYLIQPQVTILDTDIGNNKKITINGISLTNSPKIQFNNPNSCITSTFQEERLVVTNTSDAGAGSLRQCILNANADGGGEIKFRIPGTPPHKITCLSELPVIFTPTQIDGSTQPENGYTGSGPKIELDGTGLAGSPSGLRLLAANNAAVYGLYIHGFSIGIRTENSYYPYPEPIKYGGQNIKIGDIGNKGNVISGNLNYGILLYYVKEASIQNNKIGTDPQGKLAMPNGDGIFTKRDTNTTINNNLISGNSKNGIYCDETFNIKLTGNFIGTDISGLLPLSNIQSGVNLFFGNQITIGGTGEGNLISGNNSSKKNSHSGINIENARGKIRIIGNKIGTDVYGLTSIENYQGINVFGVSSVFIGGHNSGEGNLISGNNGNAIYASQVNDTLAIRGNYIGTNFDGSSAIPNMGHGIYFRPKGRSLIGGPNPGEMNLISGNKNSGIYIEVSDLPNLETIVQNNIIGLNLNGTNAIPNGVGITTQNSMRKYKIIGNIISGNLGSGLNISGNEGIIKSNKIGTDISGTFNIGNGGSGITFSYGGGCIIGGPSDIDANIIAFNALNGVTMSYSGTNNLITRNKFLGNTQKGIAIVGPPSYSPVITWASSKLIEGTAPANSQIELYYNHEKNNFSQGETYIATVLANEKGQWKLEQSIDNPFHLTALAIDTIRQTTSEFSDLYNYTEWTGANGSAFNNPLNWTKGLPTDEVHTVISSAKFKPVIAISDTIYAYDIYIAADAGLVMEGGKLTISKGHFENNGNSYLGWGTITFKGSNAQKIYGNNKFSYLSIENTGAGVILQNDQIVQNHLQLSDGVISTLENNLSILSNLPNSIEGFSAKSFINGNLTRAIKPNESIYAFPVGSDATDSSFHRIDVINGFLEGTTSITASVKSIEESGNNDDLLLIAADNELTYTDIKENAIWTLTPNVLPSAGTYGVRLYTENIENLKDNEFASLKRPDNSTNYAEWESPMGTVIPIANTSGRTISGGYAERLGYTSFSEHAIATGTPSVITNTNNGNHNNNLDLYPNPASDRIRLSNLPKEISLEILNSSGRSVFTNNAKTQSGGIEVSVAELPSGLYLIKINSVSGNFTKSFIKE